MKKKIAEIKDVLYSVGKFSCEPTKEDIEKAIRENNLETRSFQGDIDELNSEWNKEARNSEAEYYACQKEFNARKIAYFMVVGWKDPILLHKDECTILDGSHRLKAAKYLDWEEVDVIVTDAPPNLPDDVRSKLWAAIKAHGNIDRALCDVKIEILKK